MSITCQGGGTFHKGEGGGVRWGCGVVDGSAERIGEHKGKFKP